MPRMLGDWVLRQQRCLRTLWGHAGGFISVAAVPWSCEGTASPSDKGHDVCSQEKTVCMCARTLIHTCLLVPGENRAAARQVQGLFTVYPIQKIRQALTEERFAKKLHFL